MTKLPDISGPRVVKALQKAGWTIKSQKGSHVKLTKQGRNYSIIVPIHARTSIPKGTLSSIIRDAGLSVDEFVELL